MSEATMVNEFGKPCCTKCKKSIGWTRVIQRRHAGKTVWCWMCVITGIFE